MSGERSGNVLRRPWARVLVPLYRAGLWVEGVLRVRGVPKVERLGWPVVSVGSLSAGGAGKTPVVIALAEMLAASGWGVDVLSRGYGRSNDDVSDVIPEREDAAKLYGDEPVLIARRTGLKVHVGSKRREAGWLAEIVATESDWVIDESTLGGDGPVYADEIKKTHPERPVHLLDDGFQHRELHRDFDVVLVTAEDLDDALLPAGNLREPMEALRRADAVVVRADEVERVAKRVWPLLREGAQMWTVRRTLRFPEPLGVLTAGLRPLAFCALARPEGFAAALVEAGCGVVDTVVFRDHARYGASELGQIVAFAKKFGATGLVTTEKDAVKLDAAARSMLERECGALCVVRLDAVFEDEAAVVAAIGARIGGGAA